MNGASSRDGTWTFTGSIVRVQSVTRANVLAPASSDFGDPQTELGFDSHGERDTGKNPNGHDHEDDDTARPSRSSHCAERKGRYSI